MIGELLGQVVKGNPTAILAVGVGLAALLALVLVVYAALVAGSRDDDHHGRDDDQGDAFDGPVKPVRTLDHPSTLRKHRKPAHRPRRAVGDSGVTGRHLRAVAPLSRGDRATFERAPQRDTERDAQRDTEREVR